MTMTRWRVATASTLIALALIAGAAGADVDLPSVIGSHMVLQRDRWVPIWGWADANEDIVVTVIGADGPVNTEKARAADDGTWKVKIRPRPAGGPYTITVQGVHDHPGERALRRSLGMQRPVRHAVARLRLRRRGT